MQGDGNLVVYDRATHPLWDAKTGGHPGAYLALQDDGNLVVYTPGHQPLWATGTDRGNPRSGPQNLANAVTADKGLAEIGTRRATGWNQPDECVMSVSRWLSAAGGRMVAGYGPTQNYVKSPATEVSLGEAAKGDVFQYASNAYPNDWLNGVHTGVIVQNYATGRFWIVQSNAPGYVNGVWRSDSSGLVTENRSWVPSPPAGFSVHIWRFGR